MSRRIGNTSQIKRSDSLCYSRASVRPAVCLPYVYGLDVRPAVCLPYVRGLDVG